MRKLAFGYSTKCNIRCEHCVATEDLSADKKMDSDRAREIIVEMAQAGVGGISFSAGEPFLYFNEIVALVKLCQRIGIYTRMVTNSFWAKTAASSDRRVSELKKNGLCQLRLSFSRWHQKHVNKDNVLNAARSCQKIGLTYFISFVRAVSAKARPHVFPRTGHLCRPCGVFQTQADFDRLPSQLLRHEPLSDAGS